MAKHTLEIFRCEHCKIFKSMFGHLSTCEMRELEIISCKKFNTFRRMSLLENPEDWPTFCCSFRVARFKHEKKKRSSTLQNSCSKTFWNLPRKKFMDGLRVQYDCRLHEKYPLIQVLQVQQNESGKSLNF